MRPMLVGIVIFLVSITANELAKSNDAPPSYNQHYGEIADPSVWPISAVGVVTVALLAVKFIARARSLHQSSYSQPRTVCSMANCWSVQGVSDF
jgi:hypothetical protein